MELNKKRTLSGNFAYDERSIELVTILDCWLTLREKLVAATSGWREQELADLACNTLMHKHWDMMEATCPDPDECEKHTQLSGDDGDHYWRYRSYKNASARPYYYKSVQLNKLKQPDMRRCPGYNKRNKLKDTLEGFGL